MKTDQAIQVMSHLVQWRRVRHESKEQKLELDDGVTRCPASVQSQSPPPGNFPEALNTRNFYPYEPCVFNLKKSIMCSRSFWGGFSVLPIYLYHLDEANFSFVPLMTVLW